MNIIEQAAAAGVHGFLHPDELTRLMELATGREVLEVGAFMGLSAWGMAQTAKSVTSVDTFRAHTDGQRQADDITTLAAYQKAVERFDNVKYPYVGTSEQAWRVADHIQFDMIFIDAMHDYENVKADIARWWPRVRDGGVFAMHDYAHGDFPGVKQAADEVFGPAPDGSTVVTLRWITK